MNYKYSKGNLFYFENFMKSLSTFWRKKNISKLTLWLLCFSFSRLTGWLWATFCGFGTSHLVWNIWCMFLFGTLGNQELWLSCICSKGPEIVSIITLIITANKSNICRIWAITYMRRHSVLTFFHDNPCISDSSKSLVIFKTQTMCDYDYDYDSLQDFTLLSQSRTTLNFSFSAMVK